MCATDKAKQAHRASLAKQPMNRIVAIVLIICGAASHTGADLRRCTGFGR
jgi:hypothetical protein